jgi:hypothetical protein
MVSVTEEDETMSDETYEALESRRMWGVFDAIGYSADPIALFRDERSAREWLAWDKSRGDDATVWCGPCVCAVDGLTGRVWNSTEPPPEAP